MKSYKKNYIGKGVQNQKLENIVKVTLKVSELQKFVHEYQGEEYLSFELARLSQPDAYGRTHTAYVVSHEEAEYPEATKKPTKKDKPKTDKKGKIIADQIPSQEIPF